MSDIDDALDEILEAAGIPTDDANRYTLKRARDGYNVVGDPPSLTDPNAWPIKFDDGFQFHYNAEPRLNKLA